MLAVRTTTPLELPDPEPRDAPPTLSAQLEVELEDLAGQLFRRFVEAPVVEGFRQAERFPARIDMDDVALLEEWTGALIRLPAAVNPAEAARLGQAAGFFRRRRVEGRLTDPITVRVPESVRDLDHIELEQDFGVSLFGSELPLGTGRAGLPVRVVDEHALGSERELVVELAGPGDGGVSFELTPPPTFVGGPRTQPGSADASPGGTWWERELEAEDDLRSGRSLSLESLDEAGRDR